MMKTIAQPHLSFLLKIFNFLSFCKKIRSAVALWLIMLLSINNMAWADKINAAYINTQPEPFGNLNLSTAKTYGATVFTRFNIMELTFCPSKGCSNSDTANPIYWNNTQALTADWTVPSGNQPALTVLQALNPNKNKKLFASILGMQTSNYLAKLSITPLTPNATVCGPGGSGVGNINCAVFYLDKFMAAYGINGLDIDMENGPPIGFTNLLAGIAASSTFLSKYELSFAPFLDGSTYDSNYVQGGACAFQDNGITNYIAGRQYYSGGAETGRPPSSVDAVALKLASELKQADTTNCKIKGQLKLDASKMVIGLAPYSVLGDQFPHERGFPNTCQYYYQRGNPDCAEMMKKVITKYPNIAGTFVWTLDLIDPSYYACYMGNALNGTTNDCGKPLPIPGNAGYCGPTQLPDCKKPNSIDVNAGPIWDNQDAQTKCPKTCANVNLKWNNQWTTTVLDEMSVCGCIPK